MEPAFAKALNCSSMTGGGGSVMRCKGGQPENGDTISVKITSTGALCTGTLSNVASFDTAKDRKGFVNLVYDGTCDGVVLINNYPVRIVGKL